MVCKILYTEYSGGENCVRRKIPTSKIPHDGRSGQRNIVRKNILRRKILGEGLTAKFPKAMVTYPYSSKLCIGKRKHNGGFSRVYGYRGGERFYDTPLCLHYSTLIWRQWALQHLVPASFQNIPGNCINAENNAEGLDNI